MIVECSGIGCTGAAANQGAFAFRFQFADLPPQDLDRFPFERTHSASYGIQYPDLQLLACGIREIFVCRVANESCEPLCTGHPGAFRVAIFRLTH